jgi:hypothetical protein
METSKARSHLQFCLTKSSEMVARLTRLLNTPGISDRMRKDAERHLRAFEKQVKGFERTLKRLGE